MFSSKTKINIVKTKIWIMRSGRFIQTQIYQKSATFTSTLTKLHYRVLKQFHTTPCITWVRTLTSRPYYQSAVYRDKAA